MNLVEEVKKKKEFSGLPDSVVLRALEKSGEDVKDARKFLRKYFGVFLTNRVLKNKGDKLGVHLSSKKRDYLEFYEKIFSLDGELNVKSVVDLGCGVNGFSYGFLREVVGDVSYIGVEAAGQLVDQMNLFFEENGFSKKGDSNKFDALAICGDLFDLDFVGGILKKAEKDRVVFLFQVVDALESVQRNFSKDLIDVVMENCELLVISVPLVSLSGGKKFAVKRKWLLDFLEDKYKVILDFEMFGERVVCVCK